MGCAASTTVARLETHLTQLEERLEEQQAVLLKYEQNRKLTNEGVNGQSGAGTDTVTPFDGLNTTDIRSSNTNDINPLLTSTSLSPAPAGSSSINLQYEARLVKLEAQLAELKQINERLAVAAATRSNAPPSSENQMHANIVGVNAHPSAVPTGHESPSSPIVFQPLPSPSHQPSAEEKKSRKIEFDVFLSHKRTDTADFARTLKTELTDLGGLSCFLDQDADFELGDLMTKVRGSSTLLFILSEHILESEWCQLELREAILWGLNIVLITAHGARWNLNGNVHDFPPAQLIRPELQSAFANKAIEYNRNFHKASIDQLMQRMFGRPVQVAVGEWEVPERSGETPLELLVDLTTLDAASTLSLPPTNPIQLFYSLVGWHSTGMDSLLFQLTKPFSVQQDSSTPSKYLLSAEAGWCYEDKTRLVPRSKWTYLLLDGQLKSIQTGVCKLDKVDGKVTEMSCKDSSWTEKLMPVVFEPPFASRPEIYYSLTRWCSFFPWSSKVQFSLHAQHIEAKGFDMQISASIQPSNLNRNLEFNIEELSVNWLAFDPRLNRSWVHGEVPFTSSDSKYEQVTSIHFQSDAQSSFGGPIPNRNPFTEPPLVFLSLTSVQSDLRGFHFDMRVSDITPTGCQLHRLGWHDGSAELEPPPMVNGVPNYKAPPKLKPKMPVRMIMKWLAIPATK